MTLCSNIQFMVSECFIMFVFIDFYIEINSFNKTAVECLGFFNVFFWPFGFIVRTAEDFDRKQDECLARVLFPHS